jgi:hypothetical protein
MKTITFRGKDTADLERQLWDLRQSNPKFVLKTKHPIERLPLEAKPVRKRPRAALQAQDSVSMSVDYTD